MSLDLGTANAKLSMDASKFFTGFTQAIQAAKQFEAQAKSVGKTTTEMGKNIDAVGKNLNSIGKESALAGSELEKMSTTAKGPFKDLKLAIQETENRLKAARSSIDVYKQGIDQTSASIEKSKARYEQNNQKIDELKVKLNEAKAKYGENSQEAQKYANEIIKLSNVQSELATGIDSAEDSLMDMKIALNQTEAEANRLSDTLETMPFEGIGGRLQGIGSTLSSTVTPSILAVGTAATKMSMDTEQGLATVNSILQLNKSEFSAYSQEIQQGARDIGLAYSDYAAAAYDAVSAGVKQADVTNFLAQSNKLAVAGLTDLGKATDVLTTIQNSYNMSQKDMAHVSDVLIKTQNLGKVTVDELAASMGDVIPVAASAGVSIEQLGAAYAILTANGINAAKSSTMIENLFAELNETGSQTDTILRQISGKSFAELTASGKSTGDVLQMLSEYAEKSGLKLQDLFSSSEAGNAALSLMKNGADGFNKTLDEMTNSAGSCDKAFEILNNTTEKKVSRAFAAMKNTLSDIGDAMSPIVGKVAELAESFATMASEAVNAHPELAGIIAVMGGVAAAIGPALLAIGSFVKMIPLMKDGALAVKGFFSVASIASAGPIVAMAAVAAGVVGLASVYKQNEESIKTSFDAWCAEQDAQWAAAWENIKLNCANAWQNITTTITNAMNSVSSFLSGAWNGINSFISTSLNTIKTGISGAWNWIKNITVTTWNAVKTGITSVWGGIKSAVNSGINNVKSVVTAGWNAVKSTTTTIWNGIKSGIQSAWSGIKSVVSSGANAVKNVCSSVFSGIKSILVAPFEAARSAISGILGGIKSKISSIASFGRSAIGFSTMTDRFSSERMMRAASPAQVFSEPVRTSVARNSSGGIVGDLETVRGIINGMTGNNGEEMIRAFEEAGRKAAELYIERLMEIENLAAEILTRITTNAISQTMSMTESIKSMMASMAESTIASWEAMRAALSVPIRSEIITTHRDIYITENRGSSGGSSNASPKSLASNPIMYAMNYLQDENSATRNLIKASEKYISPSAYTDEVISAKGVIKKDKTEIIDYERLGKEIAKNSKGDVKIENTYNSPKPASIKELKRQDKITERRLKKILS